jgi:hypothetical protein
MLNKRHSPNKCLLGLYFKWHYFGFHHILGMYVEHTNYAMFCCSYTAKIVKQETSIGHNKCVILHYNLCPKYFVIPVITVTFSQGAHRNTCRTSSCEGSLILTTPAMSTKLLKSPNIKLHVNPFSVS